jgi:hypothetical protein
MISKEYGFALIGKCMEMVIEWLKVKLHLKTISEREREEWNKEMEQISEEVKRVRPLLWKT